VLLAVAAGAAGAPILGLPSTIGVQLAGLAMLGDLLSSFCKRRLGRPRSSQALGLDQVPESLLPLWGAAAPLGLGVADVALGVAAFFAGELVLSRLLFRLHIRDRPF